MDLFDPPAQSHSLTSMAASVAIEPRAATLRRAVLDWLRGRGDEGATDEEIQDALSMNPSTQRPRRIELMRGGLVVDTGRTRTTKSNRKACVWAASSGRA